MPVETIRKNPGHTVTVNDNPTNRQVRIRQGVACQSKRVVNLSLFLWWYSVCVVDVLKCFVFWLDEGGYFFYFPKNRVVLLFLFPSSVCFFVAHQKTYQIMAVLSKQVIEGIAQKMTEKSKNHSAALALEYKELVTTIFESQVPEAVMDLFKGKNCGYVETTTSVYLDGHGLNRQSVALTRACPSEVSYGAELKLTSATADKIVKLKRKKEKADEDYKQLVLETESALFALKTFKNIKENLPEAIPFLPPPMSNSLVVNFKTLQTKLSKQPEAKKELAVS